jgi:hypothetical protein
MRCSEPRAVLMPSLFCFLKSLVTRAVAGLILVRREQAIAEKRHEPEGSARIC